VCYLQEFNLLDLLLISGHVHSQGFFVLFGRHLPRQRRDAFVNVMPSRIAAENAWRIKIDEANAGQVPFCEQYLA
jgi:hypothetical protein